MNDGISQIADDMPEPQEHAINTEQAREAVKSYRSNSYSHLTDRNGEAFDPDIHVTDENGEPKLTQNGSLRIKPGKGSSKYKRDQGSSVGAGPRGQTTGAAAGPPRDPYAAGAAIADSIFALGQVIGGDEWAPVHDPKTGTDERAQMKQAWGRYCAEKGIGDVPPGVAVTMVTVAYIAPRLAMPKTKTRLQRAKDWIGNKVARYRMRRAGINPDTGYGDAAQ